MYRMVFSFEKRWIAIQIMVQIQTIILNLHRYAYKNTTMDKSVFPTLKKFAIVLLGLFLLHAAINVLFFPLLEMFSASDSVKELYFKFWGYQIYLCNLIGCCFLAAEMWKRGRWNVLLLVAALLVGAIYAIIFYLIFLYAEKRKAAWATHIPEYTVYGILIQVYFHLKKIRAVSAWVHLWGWPAYIPYLFLGLLVIKLLLDLREQQCNKPWVYLLLALFAIVAPGTALIWVLLGMAVDLQSPRLRFYMKYMGISFAFICLIELIFHIFNYIFSCSWIPQIQSYQMMTVVNSVLMILRVLIIVLFVVMFIRDYHLRWKGNSLWWLLGGIHFASVSALLMQTAEEESQAELESQPTSV